VVSQVSTSKNLKIFSMIFSNLRLITNTKFNLISLNKIDAIMVYSLIFVYFAHVPLFMHVLLDI